MNCQIYLTSSSLLTETHYSDFAAIEFRYNSVS